MNTTVKKAKKLIEMLNEKRHPEYGTTKIRGCKLSPSDVDTAILYAETIIKEGGTFSSLMPIYDSEVKKLFEKFDLPTSPLY